MNSTIEDEKNKNDKITAGSVVKYMVLPRILPRIASFITTGFRTFAYFMAYVLSTTRLIPEGHPFLQSQNIGRYGIITVLAYAASQLEFKKEKADQIIVFSVVTTAFVLLALQIFMLASSFVFGPAMAQSIANIFAPYAVPGNIPVPPSGTAATSGTGGEFDIAMILLDRVFGVPNIFNSCVSNLAIDCTGINTDGTNAASETQSTSATFPWPFHEGLHQMYLFYSLALLVVGMFIFIYFIMVVLIETAQTGTPFGRRFNNVWAPIRMVVAVGLLIPFAYGMNSAQFITLYAAKWGSGLATTAWFEFNRNLTSLTESQKLIGTPTAQSAAQLVSFMSLAFACERIEEFFFAHDPAVVGAPLVRDVDAFLVKNDSTNPTQQRVQASLPAADYTQALNFYDNGNIVITFGDEDPWYANPVAANRKFYSQYKGYVLPSCGEVTINTNGLGGNGTRYIAESYYNLVRILWGGTATTIPTPTVTGAVNCNTTTAATPNLTTISQALKDSSVAYVNARLHTGTATAVGSLDYFTTSETRATVLEGVRDTLQCIINNAVLIDENSTVMGIPQDLLLRGWAGAGIWYNKIAAANGAISSVAMNIPQATEYPLTMKRIAEAKLRVDPNSGTGDLYDPEIGPGQPMINLPRDSEIAAGRVYYDLYSYWVTDLNSVQQTSAGGNIISYLVMQLFGLQGLYSIQDNIDVHPLARLVSVGKSLIDSTIMNLTGGVGALFLGVAAGHAKQEWTEIGKAAGDIIIDVMFNLATVGLTAGFILYYIVPFLPFIYFFFAVGNWLKTVFEAMVGVPLWALAHIRIDGNGLPGDAAMNGYYLIFEIFLRPIMIIFGLIAGISVFAAMATVLHDVWDIVVANVGGTGDVERATFTDKIRAPVDKLFYLVVYTIVMYMMAVSSFKLVELIPQQILRWMGANVSSFVDQSQDAAGGLVQYASIGGGHMFSQVSGGAKQGLKGVADLARAK